MAEIAIALAFTTAIITTRRMSVSFCNPVSAVLGELSNKIPNKNVNH